MSAGARIPRAHAERAVAHLRDRLGLEELGGEEDGRPLAVQAVGSIRRLCPDVGDVELIAPMPHPDEGDPLHDALARHFYDDPAEPAASPPPPPAPKPRQLTLGEAAAVEAPPPPAPPPAPPAELAARGPRYGFVVQGLKPGFRAASLALGLKHPVAMPLPIQVYRFDPGPEGNRGWIELMRTGPAEFGRHLLTRWKQRRGHGPGQVGSEDGYFVDEAGRRVATPTEAMVFGLVGLGFVAPLLRQGMADRWGASKQQRRRWA